MATPILFRPNEKVLEPYPDTFTDLTYFNMIGDYGYLGQGYYDSLDAELANLTVAPTSAEALDAYVVPIAMAKAAQHGLAVPEHAIITDKLTPTAIAYPINPFSSRFELVGAGDDLAAKLKTLTMNGKYAALRQTIPADCRIDVVRCVLGHSLVDEYGTFARDVFRVFRLPLMRIRVIVTASDYLLSAIEPLPWNDLTLNEKKLLADLGTLQG